MLFIKDHKSPENVDKLIKNTNITDIKGNICDKAAKLLQVTNLRNMNGLLSSVDQGNYDIFRFIIELSVHIQKTQATNPVLSLTIN